MLRVLAVRSQALNERNLPLYLSVVSRAYRHRAKDYDAVANAAAEMFRGAAVRHQPGENTVRIRGNRAEVSGSYRIRIIVQGRETELAGQEHLVLARETDGWKIVAGL